jgi:hypothetical protein
MFDMSKQLAISSALSVMIMALFVLYGHPAQPLGAAFNPLQLPGLHSFVRI